MRKERHYEIHTKARDGTEGDLLILKVDAEGKLEVLMHPFEPDKKIFVSEIQKGDLGEITSKYRPGWQIFKQISEQSCMYQP